MGVGINRHHERCRHRRECRVESVVLPLIRLKDASVLEAQTCARSVREPGGVVCRVVVGDDDLHSACI